MPQRVRPGSTPTTVVPVAEESKVKQVLRLVDALEDNDDVQDVYTNADIDEDLLETVEV